MREHTPSEITILDWSPEDAAMDGWLDEAGDYVKIAVSGEPFDPPDPD